MKKNYEIRLSKGAVRDLKKMEPALRDSALNIKLMVIQWIICGSRSCKKIEGEEIVCLGITKV